jgi:UDP-N-acetylmuramoylalanine--D-glutamate ligase
METRFEDYFRQLQGKRIAVLGLGVSNRPLVRLLLEFGCDVTGCDRTDREKLDQEVLDLEKAGCKLRLGENYLSDVEADVVFRTPGMHPGNPAIEALRAQGAAVTSEMEAFFQVCPCRILAVTGSDGKTTTTTLVAKMLEAAGKKVWLGGNIGTPLLPLTRQMRPEDFVVVELSSFQLMDMTRSASVAVVTNLSPNHLDVHKDMEEYVEAKKNIYRFQNEQGKLIVNADNALTAALTGPGSVRTFSRLGKGDCHIRDGVIYRDDTAVLDTADILLPGVHNIENYMAAIAAVEGLVSDETVVSVAKTFGGVEHRIELVRIKDGVRYYNDSIASSPSRTIAGLRSFTEKVILIAGGYDKNIPFDVLGPEICAHVKVLVLGGATGAKIRAAVESCPGEKPVILECADFTAAVTAAVNVAKEGDVVLMSPASAAFDQFKNFMVRGAYFKKMIMEL